MLYLGCPYKDLANAPRQYAGFREPYILVVIIFLGLVLCGQPVNFYCYCLLSYVFFSYESAFLTSFLWQQS